MPGGKGCVYGPAAIVSLPYIIGKDEFAFATENQFRSYFSPRSLPWCLLTSKFSEENSKDESLLISDNSLRVAPVFSQRGHGACCRAGYYP